MTDPSFERINVALRDLLRQSADSIGDESKKAVEHYLDHDEHEMALEGLLIDLLARGRFPATFDWDQVEATAWPRFLAAKDAAALNNPMGPDPSALERAFRQGMATGGPLAQADRLKAMQEARTLLNAMLSAAQQSGRNLQDAVADTMVYLESVQPTEPSLTALLMAYLYPIASDAYVHEVADGIELFMDLQTGDVALARRHVMWAEWIEGNATGSRQR